MWQALETQSVNSTIVMEQGVPKMVPAMCRVEHAVHEYITTKYFIQLSFMMNDVIDKYSIDNFVLSWGKYLVGGEDILLGEKMFCWLASFVAHDVNVWRMSYPQ